MSDLIDRQAAIDGVKMLHDVAWKNWHEPTLSANAVLDMIKQLPPAEPKHNENPCQKQPKKDKFGVKTGKTCEDCISRQAAIDVLDGVKVDEENCTEYDIGYNDGIDFAVSSLSVLPSAQPERTCVNCGRTVNNGGWYADGGTRCPIEEHYALPKDGYCHLWEKRNVTDDNYPERREE